MLRSGTVIRLHELQASGKSIREIMRETGHSRNTIRKYLRADGIPEPNPRKKRASKLDPFKSQVDQYMSRGIFNCEVLLRLLRQHGYTGGITTLKDYVKPHRPPKQAPAVQRYETKPGYQAQVDWKICEYVDENGEVRKIPAFAMVLGYSRCSKTSQLPLALSRRCAGFVVLRPKARWNVGFNSWNKTLCPDDSSPILAI